MVEVLIGIGSNLDQPLEQVKRAIATLGHHESCQQLRASSLYVSSPQGPQDQDDFVNAVVWTTTSLGPLGLLNMLQEVERSFGKVKKRHWGERVIDLDILFYGQKRVDHVDPNLRIPHAEALNRDFVVVPALEVAPNWRLPDGSLLADHQQTNKRFVTEKVPFVLVL